MKTHSEDVVPVKKFTISFFAILCLFLSILTSIFAQDAAYFLHDIVPTVYPIHFLTGVTIVGVSLFLLATMVMAVKGRKERKSVVLQRYLIAAFMLGVPSTLWSLFILVAWWSGM